MRISVSQGGKGKVFTYGFNDVEITLEQLTGIANKNAVSGPTYKNGHRKGENIIRGSNIILIDCDEPGQAEIIEQKLQHYDYVKVPSASNLEHPYKWHFIIPTQEPLSIYPAAFKWQVEQFFRQICIDDSMIDTTGSYDIARQFAPASIGMSIKEADELSKVHDADLQAPVSEPPEELCTIAAQSVHLDIQGTNVSDLPQYHLWYQGKAVSYDDARKAIVEAQSTKEKEDNKLIISGFGCPHDNHSHTGNRTRGYGFAFVNNDGELVIKCTGNECKEDPYFTIPAPKVEIHNDTPATESFLPITKHFIMHWENNLGNVSSNALIQNWNNNFTAFDESIERNITEMSGLKICCPSPTGSGKTQQIIQKAITLYKSDVGTLIVVMRTADADEIASQIKQYTQDDYVAVSHSNEVSKEGVRQANTPDSAQCLIITHEKFRRQEKTITDRRHFIVIDEAIDVIRESSITQQNLENMIKIAKKKGNIKNERLQSEIRMMEDILHIQFKAFNENGKSFKGLRTGSVSKALDALPDLEFNAFSNFIENKSLSPSLILLGHKDKKIDDAMKTRLSHIAKTIKLYFRQFNFMTKHGTESTWHTASELIPNKSIVVMDATASVNKSYELYAKYQPDRLKILPPILCRDYRNVTLHTVRTTTGRYTILGKNILEEKVENKNKPTDPQKFMNNIMRNSDPGDEILIVTFKELKAKLKTFAESVNDRTIHIDHWGNLTGTNKYQYCNKIFLLGLPHKGEGKFRNIHALIKSPTESFQDTDENIFEMKSLINSDLIAEAIQAINRIRCRRVTDNRGNCDSADVFLTLPANYEDSQIMMIALKAEMTNINYENNTWDIAQTDDAITVARVYSVEAFMNQLEVMLKADTFEVSLDEVLSELVMSRKQYRENIKNKTLFKKALDISPYFLEMRHRTDKRGRALQRKESWFVLGK